MSYIIKSFVNFSIISKLNQDICNVVKIISVNSLNNIGMLSHIFLFSLGLITLTYMTLNYKSKKTYSLLLLLILLAFLFTTTPLPLFHILSSVLLIYVTIHFFKNYLGTRRLRNLLMLIAFAFLLFGHIHFIFSISHGYYYVIGHFLELIAYILIITNLLLVIRR